VITTLSDLKCIAKVVSGILILRKGKSAAWTTDIDNAMNAWVGQYVGWLENTDIAIQEALATK
jgi:hypothetical protein